MSCRDELQALPKGAPHMRDPCRSVIPPRTRFMRKVVARVVRAARFFAALVARVASGCKQERQERRMGRCGRTEVCIMARYVV